MHDLNVYALRMPMFAERMDIQIPSKRTEERRQVTHAPLLLAVEGEIRTAYNSRYAVEVRADRDAASGRLRWSVLRYKPQVRDGRTPPRPISEFQDLIVPEALKEAAIEP